MRYFQGTILVFASIAVCHGKRYTPDWPSLDARPLPDWYDEAKIGIFMHFGVYTVTGVSAWFWEQLRRNSSESDRKCIAYLKDNYSPKFTYQDFGPMLTMEFFNASEVADIVASSGAKYLVFTSKHHEGFCNWPSKYSFGWNAVDVGPKRNVLQELKTALHKGQPDFHFGLYYSLFEFFNPIYLSDKSNNFTTREYVKHKMLPEMQELINTFEPDVLWSDGDWEAPPEYFGSQEFLAWLYNDSPSKDTIVTNDRWGRGTMKKHGGFYSGPDRFSPGVLQSHKWEQAMTVDRKAWLHRRDIKIEDVLSPLELLTELAKTVSCGGNILINVGPNRDGQIIPIFQERLKQLGRWLEINGDSIYGTKPWIFQNDTSNGQVWYTSKDKAVFGIVLGWPKGDTLEVAAPHAMHGETRITLLGGDDHSLKFHVGKDKMLRIRFPSMSQYLDRCGPEYCHSAYVLKFENLTNFQDEQEMASVEILLT